jgi:ABC-type antimicrobial peptide transport system permease subunit
LQLVLLFSGVAFVLAVAGAYGAVSFTTRRRTQEFGVRLALGATPADIRSLVLGDGARLALVGVAIGLVVAFALTRLLAAFLFEVTPTDPLTFGVLSALLAGAVLAACSGPARRAVRVDPVTVLRE